MFLRARSLLINLTGKKMYACIWMYTNMSMEVPMTFNTSDLLTPSTVLQRALEKDSENFPLFLHLLLTNAMTLGSTSLPPGLIFHDYSRKRLSSLITEVFL